jgi:hypothetical protein
LGDEKYFQILIGKPKTKTCSSKLLGEETYMLSTWRKLYTSHIVAIDT